MSRSPISTTDNISLHDFISGDPVGRIVKDVALGNISNLDNLIAGKKKKEVIEMPRPAEGVLPHVRPIKKLASS